MTEASRRPGRPARGDGRDQRAGHAAGRRLLVRRSRVPAARGGDGSREFVMLVHPEGRRLPGARSAARATLRRASPCGVHLDPLHRASRQPAREDGSSGWAPPGSTDWPYPDDCRDFVRAARPRRQRVLRDRRDMSTPGLAARGRRASRADPASGARQGTDRVVDGTVGGRPYGVDRASSPYGRLARRQVAQGPQPARRAGAGAARDRADHAGAGGRRRARRRRPLRQRRAERVPRNASSSAR